MLQQQEHIANLTKRNAELEQMLAQLQDSIANANVDSASTSAAVDKPTFQTNGQIEMKPEPITIVMEEEIDPDVLPMTLKNKCEPEVMVNIND